MPYFNVQIMVGNDPVRNYRVEAISAAEAWTAARDHVDDEISVRINDGQVCLIHGHFKVDYHGKLVPGREES